VFIVAITLTILGYGLIVLFLALIELTSLFIEKIPTKEKTTAFECGFASFSDVFGPFNVQYYFTALYFLVFDLELAILIPVIPILPVLSPFGFIFFLFFLLAMLICVIYERLAFNLSEN